MSSWLVRATFALLACVVALGALPTDGTAATTGNLDNDGKQWEMWVDPAPKQARWQLGNVANPSLDGKALRVGLRGGDPYAGLHAYRSLPAVPAANTFELRMSFRYASAPTPIQAIEFSLSEWHDSKRWEWALQWQNIQDGGPEQGAAKSWRLWDGATWLNTGVVQALQPDRWYALTLTGEITADGRVYYRSFSCNGQTFALGQTYDAVAGEYEALTVAVQLDGDDRMRSQDLYIDQVAVETR